MVWKRTIVWKRMIVWIVWKRTIAWIVWFGLFWLKGFQFEWIVVVAAVVVAVGWVRIGVGSLWEWDRLGHK